MRKPIVLPAYYYEGVVPSVEMPEHISQHVQGNPCPDCELGIRYVPDVNTFLPLFLRQAVLHYLEAIVWCACPMGQNRKGYAERTMNDVLTVSIGNGIRGEFVASHQIEDIRNQLSAPPTVRYVEPAPPPAPPPAPAQAEQPALAPSMEKKWYEYD